MQVFINSCLLQHCDDVSKIDAVVYDDFNNCQIERSDFIFGSIEDCSRIKNMRHCMFFNVGVTNWLAFLKEEYLNSDGYFKQAWQIDKNDIGKFCRSNNGKKGWSGQIIKSNVDLQTIHQWVMEDELLYFSSAKNIVNEKRFWVLDSQIIGYSSYYNHFNQNQNIDDKNNEAIQYVQKIIDVYYEPDVSYTIDIGWDVDANCFKVIEYNCFSTSGFYKADVNRIVKAVIKKYS